MAVAFDKKGPTFRHKKYAEYKATRAKAPQELYDQIPIVKDVIKAFGLPLFETDGFEADDILATIAKKLEREGGLEILIASGDFDVFQIVRPHVAILYPTKGFKEAETFHQADIEKKYGLVPSQIPDYKGLAGDSSDNIKGVYGIGEKGAKDLLWKYKNLDGIYKHLAELSEGLRNKLEKDKASAFESRELATLRSDVPLEFNLQNCRVKNFDAKSVRSLLEQLGFKSLIKRLDDLYGEKTAQTALF